jgi:hypothetical protein
MAQMSETGINNLHEDILRQLNYYTLDATLPMASRTEFQRTVTEVWTKARIENS